MLPSRSRSCGDFRQITNNKPNKDFLTYSGFIKEED